MKLPKLPRFVYHPMGNLPVILVKDLKDEDGKDVFGLWDPFVREIRIRSNMLRVNQWSTLFHERTHADLADIGIVLSTDQEEAICNAIANCRVQEMLAKP